MTDFRAELQLLFDDAESFAEASLGHHYLWVAALNRAHAALAEQPVVPTDEDLLDLMPETMRDEFSYAAKTCSDAMGGAVKPGIFRVVLNTVALEYARAVLARWGQP